ncbi:class II fructose-bisphosphate aldolase, partial [Acinetobacter sp. 163]|nr:class II fructose-bisphosphate aldolase [Acinetobacter sp. 163]
MGGFKMVADMVRDLHDSMGITVPVALHLDHGTYEGAKKCMEVGFTSVMFDGSHYSIEENIEKSKEIIALAH